MYNISGREDMVRLLLTEDKPIVSGLFNFADEIRKKYVGDKIILRGVVEFSNFCGNKCFYCGLNANNDKAKRYKMSSSEIMDSVRYIDSLGIRTVILQSGEDRDMDPLWLARLIKDIKSKYDMAVTLSVGEWAHEDYRIWKSSGADRYLLKIETTNKALYETLHPGMSFENRINCIKDLKSLGYQVGSGNIVGLKGQTLESIADDIMFFKEMDLDMIGIGPFIPHPETGLCSEGHGDAELTLKAIAVTRIFTKRAHIPSVTAFSSIDKDFRKAAFNVGANVFMKNFTPERYYDLYGIYPGREKDSDLIHEITHSTGREIDRSKGDAVYV